MVVIGMNGQSFTLCEAVGAVSGCGVSAQASGSESLRRAKLTRIKRRRELFIASAVLGIV
jgi:hypothetical protein